MSDTTPVAIACQGGGSHTAFSAGVLKGLLRDWNERYELVGISGTSGGAFNALATWYGLVTADEGRAIELLDAIWTDLAADTVVDRATNQWLVGWDRIESSGVPWPRISPYLTPGSELGKARIRRILERHIDFDSVPDLCGRDAPELVVGTVDINAGVFETFTNERVTPEAILASAAVPELFEAVEINDHYHWDGLFSQNPPIDDLLTLDSGRKPEELWVIQINPQEREDEPTSLAEIADRRNELSGNISLNQELRFVKRVNRWIDDGLLPTEDFATVDIRRIEFDRAYHCSTKLDRRPAFIQELMNLGEERAAAFYAE
ncbi:MAG: patatin-like phospholipase family protein [Haloplanus sp.]